MNDDDGEMIRRSLDQPVVFAELYDRHQRVVYRYAARRLDVHVAEDITSETFLVAFDRRDHFVGGDARPWLLGIATLLISKHARQEARAWKGMVASDLARVDVDQIEHTDARLDAAVLAGRVGRAIARLSPGDRDALLLHAYGGLDYEGVARALSIPVGTVRSRLNRARRKVRTSINNFPSQEVTGGRTHASAALPE